MRGGGQSGLRLVSDMTPKLCLTKLVKAAEPNRIFISRGGCRQHVSACRIDYGERRCGVNALRGAKVGGIWLMLLLFAGTASRRF